MSKWHIAKAKYDQQDQGTLNSEYPHGSKKAQILPQKMVKKMVQKRPQKIAHKMVPSYLSISTSQTKYVIDDNGAKQPKVSNTDKNYIILI